MLVLEVVVRVAPKLEYATGPLAYREQHFRVEGDPATLLTLVATNQKTGEAVRAMVQDLIAQEVSEVGND